MKSQSLVRRVARVIPRRVQVLVHERLPPQFMAAMVRRLGRFSVAGWPRYLGALLQARWHFRSSMRSQQITVVTVGSRRLLATAKPQLSPIELRRANLDAIVTALEAAGITHFRVRGYSPTIAVIGIPAAQRTRALSALRGVAKRAPVYVSNPSQDGKVRHRLAARGWAWLGQGRGDVVRFTRFHCDRKANLVLGADLACEVEFWHERSGVLHAPRPNRVAEVLPLNGNTVITTEAAFTQLHSPIANTLSSGVTREEFLGQLIDQIGFPIDVVYTWVDGSDLHWRSRRDEALSRYIGELSEEAVNESRFANHDELRYSMRSLSLFAPWVNHIWLVTDRQTPAWLDTSHEKVTVVDHRDLFSSRGALPTFNSHAIETQLHRLSELSEHFLYFNDDVMLGRPVFPEMFFESNGLVKVVLSNAKVDPGVASYADTPATAAGKNNRELMKELGIHVSYKLKHCPHPLRRSVLRELEHRFSTPIDATSTRQFRHLDDISLTSSLFQYYALATQRAVVSDLRYMYADIARPNTPRRLTEAALTRDIDVICINDTNTDIRTSRRVTKFLEQFLGDYYPVPAPWESV